MTFYFVVYVIDFKTAHRMIHYFEEEAVRSYTDYLGMVERGEVENLPAPQLAIEYYDMRKSAKLSDLIKKVRADEEKHSKINMEYSL
jgi:ubiquinol oxidase